MVKLYVSLKVAKKCEVYFQILKDFILTLVIKGIFIHFMTLFIHIVLSCSATIVPLLKVELF